LVENNRQTSAETSREALRRYFSSSGPPTVLSDQNSVGASIAAHEAQAQVAIDAVDATMRKMNAEHKRARTLTSPPPKYPPSS
jgi:hypothetical protein